MVAQLTAWADKRGMTYVAATEYAMRALLEQEKASEESAAGTAGAANADASAAAGAEGAEAAVKNAEAGLERAGSHEISDSDTLRELMAANAQLTMQLGEVQKTANEAGRNLLAATMQLKSLPSADEVEAREKVARTEGMNDGLAKGRAERDKELADLGLFGYMSWRRSQKGKSGE